MCGYTEGGGGGGERAGGMQSGMQPLSTDATMGAIMPGRGGKTTPATVNHQRSTHPPKGLEKSQNSLRPKRATTAQKNAPIRERKLFQRKFSKEVRLRGNIFPSQLLVACSSHDRKTILPPVSPTNPHAEPNRTERRRPNFQSCDLWTRFLRLQPAMASTTRSEGEKMQNIPALDRFLRRFPYCMGMERDKGSSGSNFSFFLPPTTVPYTPSIVCPPSKR